MSFGNVNNGLLKEIIEIIHVLGDKYSYDTNLITKKIRESGYWDTKDVKTPERTINSYFSQNPHVFERIEKNEYRIRRNHCGRCQGSCRLNSFMPL